MSLAAEGASRTAFAGRRSRRSRELMDAARAQLAGTDSPEARGFIALTEALCEFWSANWHRAAPLADAADRQLREHCSGVAWERANCDNLRMEIAFHRGEWAKLAEYGQGQPGRLEDAKARGDLHAIVALLLEGTIRFLMADQPAQAEEFVRQTLSVLPADRLFTPQVVATGLRVNIALYSGDGRAAAALVLRPDRSLKRSQLLRVEPAWIQTMDTKSRAVLGAAVTNNGATGELRIAAASARQLARRKNPWATALSLLIRANIASFERARQPTLDFLTRAETEFLACSMAQYVATCRYRRGQLIGGSDGRGLMAEAEQWAASQHIVNPGRVFDMLAPGRWNFGV